MLQFFRLFFKYLVHYLSYLGGKIGCTVFSPSDRWGYGEKEKMEKWRKGEKGEMGQRRKKVHEN